MKIRFAIGSNRGNLRTLYSCLVALSISLSLHPTADGSTVAIWDGSSGNWTDASHWSTNPLYPNNDLGITYEARVPAGSITLDRPIILDTLSATGGTITSDKNLNLLTRLEAAGGTFNFQPGASLSTPLIKLTAGTVNFNSDIVLPPTELSGSIFGGKLGGSGDFTITDGFTWSGGLMAGTGKATFIGNHTILSAPQPLRTARKIINTAGTFDWRAGGANGYIIFSNGASFTNAADATFVVHGELRTASQGHTTQEFFDNEGVFRQDAIYTSGFDIPFRNSGIVESLGGTLNFGGGYRQTAGITNLRGIAFTSGNGPRNVIFDGGTVIGSATIDDPTFNAAVLSIGAPFGEIRVTDSLTVLAGSRLMFDIGGLTRVTKYDSLFAETLDLGGILDVRFANGFESAIRPTDSFNIISTQRSAPFGTFSNLSDGRVFTSDGLGSFRVTINSTGVVLDDFRAVPDPLSGLSITTGLLIFLTRRRSQ
jgi:hypothetical protein